MITLHRHEISANIKDRYANIVYLFEFENTKNNGSNELSFEITIDPNAFISKFEANIDDEIFIGETKEKERASKEYNEAKEKDENAILISQPHKNIPNVFQIKTNIDAKSKILLTIQIEQYLQKKFHFNQLNIQILRNFKKYKIIPSFDDILFKLQVEDKSGIYDVDVAIINNNNDIKIDKNIMDKMNRKCQIDGKITGNSSINELILKYKLKGEEDESHILFDAKSNTFCHVISDVITNSMIPKRVMFVIDRSGSMSGSKWDKTISSTIIALKQLKKGYDRFGIILFDNNIQLLPYKDTKGCILADDESISISIELLKNNKVAGSTNINDALLKAMELIKFDILLLNNDANCKYNFFMNQIIFITDGEPNNGERDTKKIVVNVKNTNDLNKIDKYNKKISIFCFGVGRDENDSGWIKDLNHSFLKILSLNNNGFYQRIKQTSADTKLTQCFNILSKPVLTNINVEYKNENINNLTETKFNTLFHGNDLIICGKLKNQQIDNDYPLTLKISATTGQEIKENDKLITKPMDISKEIKMNINTNNTNNTERIWAYLLLQQFAKRKLINNDMIEMDDDEKKEEESLPLSLALKYQFVTPWTSMIVVKKKDQITKQKQQQPMQSVNNIKQQQLAGYHDDDDDDDDLLKQLYAARKETKCQRTQKRELQKETLKLRGIRNALQRKLMALAKRVSNFDEGMGQKIMEQSTANGMIEELANQLNDMIERYETSQEEEQKMQSLINNIEEQQSKTKSENDALSLYKKGKDRRGKKKEAKEKKAIKISPGGKRVELDLDELELPYNCRLMIPNKEDLQEFQVMITSYTGYWHGASYTFNFVIPDNYPYKPPIVTCVEKIYHPNIDLQGNVCLSLLKTDWNSVISVQQIIHSLILLLLEPNPVDPINEEAAKVYKNDINIFKENVNKSLSGGYVGGINFPKMNSKKY